MKIVRQGVEFRPVIITLESHKEVHAIRHALSVYLSEESRRGYPPSNSDPDVVALYNELHGVKN